MNLAHVQTFLVVVETGNLNKAALKLNVTQSTVTARINALEDLLGQKLLRRIKSGAELTAIGTKFVKHAQIMVQVWKQARLDTSLPRGFDQVCNFGCPDPLWNGAGEYLVNALRSEFQSIAINVESGSETDMRPLISNSIVDVAISYEPPPAPGYTIEPLFEDLFIEVSTIDRDLVRWDPKYVFVDHGEEFRRRHAEAYPVDDTAVVTFKNGVFALGHIIKWGGSAYLPYRIAYPAMEAGQVFEVRNAPRFTRTAYLVRNSTQTHRWHWLTRALVVVKEKIADAVLKLPDQPR
ncbi:LysR family transcriptional regulator [Rhizobium sp. KVB221]|uniref:LysR family transcriptional regulator n=1 Tax=Rhizobium setariae TaxID=2801340 RepID=A0A937CN28_9HYPH|nr:LysR family transcriptional regulator [Rhizobium setariae]MBL0373341.1 LysR family transcriptional regulator [Rhizobium setariae]